jgi:hypothetical protein
MARWRIWVCEAPGQRWYQPSRDVASRDFSSWESAEDAEDFAECLRERERRLARVRSQPKDRQVIVLPDGGEPE